MREKDTTTTSTNNISGRQRALLYNDNQAALFARSAREHDRVSGREELSSELAVHVFLSAILVSKSSEEKARCPLHLNMTVLLPHHQLCHVLGGTRHCDSHHAVQKWLPR